MSCYKLYARQAVPATVRGPMWWVIMSSACRRLCGPKRFVRREFTISGGRMRLRGGNNSLALLLGAIILIVLLIVLYFVFFAPR